MYFKIHPMTVFIKSPNLIYYLNLTKKMKLILNHLSYLLYAQEVLATEVALSLNFKELAMERFL